jgi:hypothetical protein
MHYCRISQIVSRAAAAGTAVVVRSARAAAMLTEAGLRTTGCTPFTGEVAIVGRDTGTG